MSTAVISEPIAQLQLQLDQIRNPATATRLPDSVWQAAVEPAREHGVYSVAHHLRLDYTGLKKRRFPSPTKSAQAGIRRTDGATFSDAGRVLDRVRVVARKQGAHAVESCRTARLDEPAACLGGGESDSFLLCLSSVYNHRSTRWDFMALRESEAVVLRTYPLREADLLVTLFTRAEGKVRGVARSAKKSKRRFGGALEPMTYVRAFYDMREGQELARLDACEVLESPLATEVSYARAVGLAHVAELLDELLPDREANDAIFRLTLSVLHALTGSDIWMPVTYFDLWLTRLVGFLPELTECIVCGRSLNGSRAYFHALADGLMCPDDKRLASSEISSESRALAAQMFRAPVENFVEIPWPKSRGADLRRFLIQALQRHIEKKLVTAGMLEKSAF
ncbi:MAG TPA: DNA repair protein RecO [Candidatus Acidoferrales bacterium]|nr:DNA repair protein RecO [Candidatus Acidoferrales bacterium]